MDSTCFQGHLDIVYVHIMFNKGFLSGNGSPLKKGLQTVTVQQMSFLFDLTEAQ